MLPRHRLSVRDGERARSDGWGEAVEANIINNNELLSQVTNDNFLSTQHYLLPRPASSILSLSTGMITSLSLFDPLIIYSFNILVNDCVIKDLVCGQRKSVMYTISLSWFTFI